MRKISQLCIIIVLLAITNSCKQEKKIGVEVKHIDYPSASGIECLDNKIYVIGDDANNLLILDSALNSIDSISLYSFTEKRIPKKLKADLESMTALPGNKLLLLGSGSFSPTRNTGWIIDPVTKQKDSIRIDTFYRRLLSNGIAEINIEGVAAIPGHIVLANRGNKAYPKNQLIFTDNNFWEQQKDSAINVVLIDFNDTDTANFSGVSGITYSAKTDALIMTVSTEDTRNSFEDGAIGKSYLWIIKNISGKKNSVPIKPDTIIELDKTDALFTGHKIESVCIIHESAGSYHLLLAADNDNGSSTLFTLTIPNN